MKLLSKFIFILGMAVLLFGCSKDGDLTSLGSGGNPVYGEKVEMTFGFTAADMESPVKVIPVTNRGNVGNPSIVLEDVPESVSTKAVNEDALNEVWVLQFDGTDNTSELVLREHYSSDKIQGNKLNVALYGTGTTKVYCIANAGDSKFSALPLNTTTLESFETMIFDFDASIADGNGLPMAGVYEGSAVAATADIPLHRMAAKLIFTLKVDLVSSNDSFTPATVQLKSVAKGTSYKSRDISVVYPARDAGNFRDYAAVSVTGSAEDLKTKGFTQEWYLPENLRGVVAGLNDQQKGGSNAPKYSTYIEITGDYTQSGESFEVVYRIYPGQNSSTDFNIIRNHQYTIGSTIRGIDENDVRVEIKAEDVNLSIDPSTGQAATANCYIVHTAGTTYKFDATVKGNGATTPVYNANGQSAPAIDGSGELTPVSAKVIWETGSKEQVIKDGSIKVKEGYVYFTTAGDKGGTVEEGNALIGVFSGADGSGTLLWSWHIWATEYDPETDNDTYVTRALTASGNIAQTSSRSYTVMKYNLGADATSAVGTVGRFGLLYQWGRKDPFVGAKTVSSTMTDYADTYNASGYAWDNQKNSDVISSATADASIAYAIQHPTTFLYYSVSPYDWMNVTSYAEQRDNLWGNPNTKATRPNQDLGKKSIYDPCPVGWRVVPQDTWTMFAKNGTGGTGEQNVSGDFTFGWNFYIDASNSKTAFYPVAGFRFSGSGQLFGVGSDGYVWSSSPYLGGNTNGSHLRFFSTGVNPLYNGSRSFGFGVRCVKE